MDMLPEGNEIPMTTYEANKIVCPMGLKFEKTHACKNDCILFCGDNAALTECPKCGTSLVTSNEPMRVMMARRCIVEFLGRLHGTFL